MPLQFTTLRIIASSALISGCASSEYRHHNKETHIRDDFFLYFSAGHNEEKKQTASGVIESKVVELIAITDPMLTGCTTPDYYFCDITFKVAIFINGEYHETTTKNLRVDVADAKVQKTELAIIKESVKRSFEAENSRLRHRQTGA